MDPNRVIDIVLDCFEQNTSERDLYLDVLKKFDLHRDDLRNILATKFVFCEVNYFFIFMCIFILEDIFRSQITLQWIYAVLLLFYVKQI